MPRFTGSYTRKNGLRRTYAYSVHYELDGNLLEWSAAVTHNGAFRGKPGGSISLMLPEQQDHRAHADFLATSAIEQLSDVEE